MRAESPPTGRWVPLDWLYNALSYWILYKLLDRLGPCLNKITSALVGELRNYIYPRLMSATYRALLFSGLAVTIVSARVGIKLFFLSGVKALGQMSRYNQEAKTTLDDIHQILNEWQPTP